MKPFPEYIIAREEPEEPAFVKNEILVNDTHKRHRVKITFGDLYCALQTHDLSVALVFAAINFEKSLASLELFEEFIKQLHKKAAKHLVMLSSTEQPSGVYRTDEVVDQKGKPMGSNVEAITSEMKTFCKKLFNMIKAPMNKNQIIDAAFFALTEVGRIHPFGNGNGRIARALANCILIHFGDLHPIVFKDKRTYYQYFSDYLTGKEPPLRKLFEDALKFSSNLSHVPIKNVPGSIDTPNQIIQFESDKINIMTKPQGFGIAIDKKTCEKFLNNCKHGLIKIFFQKFIQSFWPTQTITPQIITPIIPKTEDSTKYIEEKKQLIQYTLQFFKPDMPPGQWKKPSNPEEINKPCYELSSDKGVQAEKLSSSLKEKGFFVQHEITSDNHFITIDLAASKLNP